MRRQLLLSLIVLLFAQSCAIQKRQYLPGYHIERWNDEAPNRSINCESKTQSIVSKPHKEDSLVSDRVVLSVSPVLAERPMNHLPNPVEKEVAVQTPNYTLKDSRPMRIFPGVLSSPVHFLFGRFTPYETGVMEDASLVSFVFGVLFFAVPFISSFWAIIGLIFPILAIIFGIIGMVRTKRDPSLKGRGFAIAGLILGIIGLMAIALLLVVIALTFTLYG